MSVSVWLDMQNSYLVNCAKKICLVLCTCFAIYTSAQTFENPESDIVVEAESEPAITETEESETESLPEPQLDDSLGDYLEENAPLEVGQENEFDSFVPSEDISEDFSVPFPVDI